jgi:hypothetical protein
MKILKNEVSKMEINFGSNYLHPVIISLIVSPFPLILRYNDTRVLHIGLGLLYHSLGKNKKASPSA